jgi:hypothetical protein
VLKQTSEVTYLVEREHGKGDVVHVDRLKRFREPRVDAPQLTQRTEGKVETKEEEAVLQETKTGFEDLDDVVLPDEDVRGDVGRGVSRKRVKQAELDGGVYEVQELLQRRISMSTIKPGEPVIEYLVRWKNWDANHDSWEPVKNLSGNRVMVEMVQEFDRAEVARDRTERALRRGDVAELGRMCLGVERVWSEGMDEELGSWVVNYLVVMVSVWGRSVSSDFTEEVFCPAFWP